MKVTPIKKKFGKYLPGQVFELPDKAARVFIKINKLKQVMDTAGDATLSSPAYQTRMMTAEQPKNEVNLTINVTAPDGVTGQDVADRISALDKIEAPYGYKADGTPRLRPSRHPVKE